MGTSKKEGFSTQQLELAEIARALSHPARVAILQYLSRVNACIGGEIVDALPLAQPTISRHLKELKGVGLIKGEIDGVRVNYCINRERWEEVQGLMSSFFSTPVDDQDCC
ncbi:MAG: winged helix-turn-helix transcriptional regulator [Phaeodactylibacter sp.]|nr:winged helix-turn-helix transcriptional regulator [Phaeodactylibacter sp.]MCB9266258.1 winged helix-turn-helix transcriptional regulator [Lewinellaceae bacterium]MCB9285981.1 winged helix-turn-helix transcriptional regulator [Lewinellaceae bacterium]